MLFIHIQKTGGNTITSLLQKHIQGTDFFLNKHDLAKWGERELGDDLRNYYRFAFVRNPWDRLVSWYSMIEHNKGKYRNKLWDYVICNSSNFEEFILKCTDVIDDLDGTKSFAYNQVDYRLDSHGEFVMDFVGKYETFERDVEKVFMQLGVPNVKVPRLNQSQHKHYSQYYTQETKEIVAERFKKDIDMFAYTFNKYNE